MKKFLVLGNPIEHSLSPEMFGWIFDNIGIDAQYKKRCVDVSGLQDTVNDIREGKISGLNITLPYKEHVIENTDILSPSAQYIRSVNCISIENNNIVGHNTDIHGFSYLINKNKISLNNKSILIIGAGGASRGVIGSLISLADTPFSLINRDREKSVHLANYFNELHGKTIVNFIEGKVDIASFDVIVNCTPIGINGECYTHNCLDGIPKSGTTLIDLLYHCIKTPFLRIGNESNKLVNGLDMFIGQGIASLDLWLGNSTSNKINSTHLKEYLNSLCLKE